MTQITVAIDAMGGDFGPCVTVPAGINALNQQPALNILFVGDEQAINAELAKIRSRSAVADRFRVKHASQQVTMDDPPAVALRQKRDSSMRIALMALKKEEADACVSAGNTGALMAISRFVLKTVTGIDRPAIITALPSTSGFTHILDLGANVDCSVEHLFQFAVMGSVVASAVGGKNNPSVGLLNVGAEEIKGTMQVKAAAKRLQESSLNYIGYVEGDDTFIGNTDVIVCDGFAGNISLKTCEGIAKLGIQTLKDALQASWWGKIIAVLGLPIFKKAAKRLDPRNYNGASLVGLRRTVIKSHGSADIRSYTNAIMNAYLQAQQDVPQLIAHKITTLMEENEHSV